MSKLKLVDIQKTYKSGEIVNALRGVSLEFRENEFVAVLGPSGCGKTTLLNIIGGLDRYDSGDLILGGLSTKNFKDADWDAYRNRSIGFVFQNYNLISHQSVLQNVEIAMTLSGVSAAERKRRATEALKSVGLSDQLHKKPTQLSGGQMQRVAIARALVNNPDIILADEPTGALDSHTSVQVMEILKKISRTKLVIMVTHNNDLANAYSSRTIQLLDGEVISDSNPLFKDEAGKKGKSEKPVDETKLTKTSMSLLTAAGLSLKNLLTKKGRTFTTAFAGSIGIIGVALVLALSTGLTSYMNSVESDTLAGFPITISEGATSSSGGINVMEDGLFGGGDGDTVAYPEENILYRYDSDENTTVHTNVFSDEYLDYIAAIETELPDAVNAVSYSRGVEMNILAKGEDSVVSYNTSSQSMGGMGGMGGMASMLGVGGSTYWQEMTDNDEFILSIYDLIGEGSRLPTAMNEVVLVVDEYNRIDAAFFEKLGIYTDADSYELTDFIGKTFLKVIPNDSFYTQNDDGVFVAASPADYSNLFNGAEGVELTITGVLRIKESASAAVGYLSEGIVYTTALTDYIVENAQNSQVAIAQKNSNKDVIANTPFASDAVKEQRLLMLGADTTPTGISIYPKNFEAKEEITAYLDAYNEGKAEENQVTYSDMAKTMSSMTSTMMSTVSLVLIAFSAISLLVSTIMIAIIIYVSVIERTKEIGILRSVGARKKDISMVFITESMLIGLVAGVLGVGLAYLLTIPVNWLIASIVGISGVANLTALYAVILVIGSMLLTLIAGFFPSRSAAKKDPVVALRTE